MYAYVFDNFVQEQKYRAESARIETRVATLGIQGRSEKITVLKNIQDSVKSLLKRGADTLVVVGNDQTVAKVLPLVVEAEAALGIIPVGPHQSIAQALGIPSGVAAGDMLSRRIMRRIDLGVIGGAHFLLQATLPAGARVKCDNAYTVESSDPEAVMTIYNLGLNSRSRPDDGQLELTIGSVGGGWFGRGGVDQSVFPFKTAKIERTESEGRIVLDGQLAINTPATVSVLRKKIHIIVGRDRTFD